MAAIIESADDAYNDLLRLIPDLTQELDSLRTSLHEHNAWLQRAHNTRYTPTAVETASQPSIEEMTERRDQTASWLSEGEEVLRQYKARLSELSAELGIPVVSQDRPDGEGEDIVGEEGTWRAPGHVDDGLPGYARIEYREELMVGGVGEELPPYTEGPRVNASVVENGRGIISG